MQERRQIDLTEDQYQLLNKKDKGTLLKLLLHHGKIIHDMLFSYHYHKKERVYEENIEENFINFTNENRGYFTINYRIGFFNACADLDYHAAEKMKIDFKFSKTELILIGEDIPEREPDEI